MLPGVSHPEQAAFFAAVADANTGLVQGGRVLEIGSYDVNGTIRSLFAGSAEYVGVDLTEGPGVDVVSFGHEYTSDTPFDATISGECFEHDPHWADSLATMIRLTRPGGLVAFSCASRGRPEHGTTRSMVDYSPGTQSIGYDYYRNLDADDIESGLDLSASFESYRLWYLPTNFDLYFAGVVKGEEPGSPTAALPAEDRVRAIEDLMSLPHRVLRLPLKAARRLVRDDERYQRVILPYWLTLLRARNAVAKRFPNAPGTTDRSVGDVGARRGA
jgi:SAM-dependent methyltransferase